MGRCRFLGVFAPVRHFFSLPRLQQVRPTEALAAPDLYGSAQKQRVRRRMTPYRVQRKQVHLEAPYGDDGEMVDNPEVVGAALRAEWAPVFDARLIDEEAM